MRKVHGGASLIVGYRLGGKHVLIVGGGKEATGRVFFALDADAQVTIVCPSEGLNAAVRTRVQNGEVAHIDRTFRDSDLKNADMVLSCIDEHEESRRIALLCRQQRIPVNCADIPDLCDFYFMAQYREGALQIGVSTNGCGPRLGARLRNLIVDSLPSHTVEAVEKVGNLRRRIREVDPDPESSARRMRWLSRLCDSWGFDQLAALDDESTLDVLDAYERGDKIPPAPPTIRRPPSRNSRTDQRLSEVARDLLRNTHPSTNSSFMDLAHSVPLVGPTVDLVASATGSAWNLTTNAVSGTVETASSAASLTSTYARAITATGSAYLHQAKTTTEDIIEGTLRLLPGPLSYLARGGLSILPLPIHVARQPIGKLVLVGAGPGDPGLLTLRALEALRTADLVVSDQLISEKIQQLVPKRKLKLAERKVAGRSDKSQNDANDLCLQALSRGLNVVRLKGGDPFLFGRGGEEILFFRQHGFEPEIVPGISSCIAAPESALIPVTHRGVADQLLVLSGRGEGGSYPDVPTHYDKRTTVVLMAVARLPDLVKLMLAKNYPPNLPAAIVEKGCWADQRVVEGTLANIVERTRDAQVAAPALLVVGGAVAVLNNRENKTDMEDLLSMDELRSHPPHKSTIIPNGVSASLTNGHKAVLNGR